MPYSKKHIVYARPEFPIFFETDSKSFYKYLDEVDFSSITEDDLSRLKEKGKKLREESCIDNINSNLELKKIYTDLMNKLKTNPKGYDINSKTEMYLIFMFTMDKDLDALKLALSASKSPEQNSHLKYNLTMKFGHVDVNLIKLEKAYYEYFHTKNNKKSR